MQAKYLFWLALLPMTLSAAPDYDREEIQQRITPVGQVRVKADKASAKAPIVSPSETKAVAKAPGQEIYDKYCSVCHRDGVAGAPKFRSEDWKPRMAQGGINELLAVAIKGLNAMPPKGTCTECKDSELKAAIEYMVPRS